MSTDLRSDETKAQDERVHRTVAAERERCAKIAERIGIVSVPPADEFERGYHEAAVQIAEAIRKSD